MAGIYEWINVIIIVLFPLENLESCKMRMCVCVCVYLHECLSSTGPTQQKNPWKVASFLSPGNVQRRQQQPIVTRNLNDCECAADRFYLCVRRCTRKTILNSTLLTETHWNGLGTNLQGKYWLLTGNILGHWDGRDGLNDECIWRQTDKRTLILHLR